jgi:hypothetical protein
MTIKEPGLTALRISYAVVRTPLGLLNDQVVARAFGADSTAHRSLTQGIQTFDALAAKAFAGCSDGPTDVRDADAPAAKTTRAPADATPEVIEVPPVDEAHEPEPEPEREDETIDAAEQQEISDLADSYLEDQALGNRAGELADDDEVRRVQAEIRAKQTIEDQHGQL